MRFATLNLKLKPPMLSISGIHILLPLALLFLQAIAEGVGSVRKIRRSSREAVGVTSFWSVYTAPANFLFSLTLVWPVFSSVILHLCHRCMLLQKGSVERRFVPTWTCLPVAIAHTILNDQS